MNDLIEKLSNLRSQFNCFNENEREAYHTLSEAIKVLSERPELCEDAVSRQKLLDEYSRLKENWNNAYNAVDKCISVLKDLPSVTSKQKTGKWVYKPNEYDDSTYECSQCKEPWTLIDGTPEENNMKFCPNCGAKNEIVIDAE